MNEWELLCVADDIEPGDTLVMEDDQGNETLMVFVKVLPKNLLEIRDINKKRYVFSQVSLEEVGGSQYITGKSTEPLDLSDEEEYLH